MAVHDAVLTAFNAGAIYRRHRVSNGSSDAASEDNNYCDRIGTDFNASRMIVWGTSTYNAEVVETFNCKPSVPGASVSFLACPSVCGSVRPEYLVNIIFQKKPIK